MNQRDLLRRTGPRRPVRRFRSAQPEGIISEWIDPDGRSDAEIARALAADGWLKINVEDLDSCSVVLVCRHLAAAGAREWGDEPLVVLPPPPSHT